MSPRWHQLPQKLPLVRFIPGTKQMMRHYAAKYMFFLRCPAKASASDYKCGDKSLVGKVPSELLISNIHFNNDMNINTHIDINTNIDIHIIMNVHRQYWYPQAPLIASSRT